MMTAVVSTPTMGCDGSALFINDTCYHFVTRQIVGSNLSASELNDVCFYQVEGSIAIFNDSEKYVKADIKKRTNRPGVTPPSEKKPGGGFGGFF